MLKYGVFKHALTATFQQFSCRPPTDNNYSSTLQRQHVVRHYQHPALRVRQLPKGLHVPERRQELQLHQEVRLKTVSDGVFHNVNSQRSHHHLATVISFEGSKRRDVPTPKSASGLRQNSRLAKTHKVTHDDTQYYVCGKCSKGSRKKSEVSEEEGWTREGEHDEAARFPFSFRTQKMMRGNLRRMYRSCKFKDKCKL